MFAAILVSILSQVQVGTVYSTEIQHDYDPTTMTYRKTSPLPTTDTITPGRLLVKTIADSQNWSVFGSIISDPTGLPTVTPCNSRTSPTSSGYCVQTWFDYTITTGNPQVLRIEAYEVGGPGVQIVDYNLTIMGKATPDQTCDDSKPKIKVAKPVHENEHVTPTGKNLRIEGTIETTGTKRPIVGYLLRFERTNPKFTKLKLDPTSNLIPCRLLMDNPEGQWVMEVDRAAVDNDADYLLVIRPSTKHDKDVDTRVKVHFTHKK